MRKKTFNSTTPLPTEQSIERPSAAPRQLSSSTGSVKAAHKVASRSRYSRSVRDTTGSRRHSNSPSVVVEKTPHALASHFFARVKSLAATLVIPQDVDDATQEAMLELLQTPVEVLALIQGDPWPFVRDLSEAAITNWRRKEARVRTNQPSLEDARFVIYRKYGEWFGDPDASND
jgi:hypothetical protein